MLLLLLYNAIVNKQSYAKQAEVAGGRGRGAAGEAAGDATSKGTGRAFLNLVKMLRESEARDANAAAAVGERARRGHRDCVPRG